MKIRLFPRAFNRFAAIHECLFVFFTFCGFTHFLARTIMERFNRQFAVMDDRTTRTMALIDWLGAHAWLAVAYVGLVVFSVVFLQFRGRPAWTCWLTALLFCIPYFMYCSSCAFIAVKFPPFMK